MSHRCAANQQPIIINIMKPNKYILPIAIASLTMSAHRVQADLVQDNGRSHKLTVSLKAHFEGAKKYDEKSNGDVKFSQKILTQKISNKEILEGLVNEGVIADIKGWSLILVTNNDADIVGIYIEKKNNVPIDVTQYFSAGSESEIESNNGKHNAKKAMTTVTTEKKSLGGIMFDIDDVMLEARGLLTRRTDFSKDEELEVEEEFVKDAKFSDMTGVFSDDAEEEEEEGLVTGSLKAAKGKKFTYNQYD